MEKRIEDYLPFYIGCPCEIKVKEGHDIEYEDGINKVDGFMVDWLQEFEYVKPLLRPLSDMKVAELNDICSILIGREITCGDIGWTDDRTFVSAYWKKEEAQDEKYQWVKMGIGIDEDMDVNYVWVYTYENGTGFKSHSSAPQKLCHHNEITRYLVKQRFDPYKLVQAGLAKWEKE